MATSGSSSGTAVTNDLHEYIKRQLGHTGSTGPVIELSVDQIDDSINNAVRLFNRYLLVMQNNVATDCSESTVIDLDDDVLGVYYVAFLFPEAQRVYAQMSVFEIVHRWFYPGLRLGEWYMLRSFYEMYQRVRGTEPDWRLDMENRKLYLDTWSGPYDVMYITSNAITQSKLMASTHGSKQKYEQDFRDLCVAYAKIPLARIRGKWNNTVPGPAGALGTDAPTLLAESKETITEIETKLKKLMRARYLPQIG